MSALPEFLAQPHDPRDPSPWLALYLDQSVPMAEVAKRAWLADTSSWSRQFLLPLMRPLARLSIMIVQLFRLVLPRAFSSSRLLHRLLEFGMKRFLSRNANFLIMRHFHLGSEILRFIGDNVAGVDVPTTPLKPTSLSEVRNLIYTQHDLTLFNFVIELNRQLAERGLELAPREPLDFSAISEELPAFDDLPDGPLNFADLETAIELYTPLYQALQTDHDFWRASNSLQLDETLGVYVSKLLGSTWQLALVNNKHPMVPMTIVRAGYRLVLHGLATECLHALLVRAKRLGQAFTSQAASRP
ncbi:MAG TPA: hypothetical protein VFZ61_02310 [Polyangiales bacterium]